MPLNQVVKNFVIRSFDIREGEMKRAFAMQAYIFLIITTLLIVKPSVNGLFLSHFGVEQLPIAYILLALVATVVSVIYASLLRSYSLYKMIITTHIGSVVLLVLFGICLLQNWFIGPTLYVFFIFVAIFALIATSQFWVLANIVFNPREAKRLFPFIGAGAIVGGILGGYLTSILVLFISSETLPIIAAGLFFFTIPIAVWIWKSQVQNKQSTFQANKKVSTPAANPLKLIRNSKHLTYIAGLVAVSVLVAKLVDYQFGAIVTGIISDEDTLTSFYGFWFSTFNVISLFIQLFITRRVVGRYGVGTSLYFLPVSILVALVSVILLPGLLLPAVMLKMADGGLKQSINKAAMELLIMPIAKEIKARTKTFIDVFVDSVATGASGLILLFLIKGLDLSLTAVNLLILVCLLIWFYLARGLKNEYVKSLRSILSKSSGPEPRSDFEVDDQSIVDGMIKVLRSGSESQKLFILEKIKDTPNIIFQPQLTIMTKDSSDAVRARAIDILSIFNSGDLSSMLELQIPCASDEIKLAIFQYFVSRKKSVASMKLTLSRYIKSKDHSTRMMALLALSYEARLNRKIYQAFKLDARISKIKEELSSIADSKERQYVTSKLLESIGQLRLKEQYKFVSENLTNEDEEIANCAIKSAGYSMDPLFIDSLLLLLKDERLRFSARAALIYYGKSIVPLLDSIVQDQSTDIEIKRNLPAVLKMFNDQNSVKILFSLLDHNDLIVRYEALRGLNTLRNNNESLSFDKKNIIKVLLGEISSYQETLSVLYIQERLNDEMTKDPLTDTMDLMLIESRGRLVSLLEKRLDLNLERIFRVLSLKYGSEDILTIYESIKSPTPEIRINAVDFLESLLEPGLKSTLTPIIETAMMDAITEEAIKQLNIQIPTEKSCFEYLLNGNDIEVHNRVLDLLLVMKNPEYIPIIKKLLGSTTVHSKSRMESVLQQLKKI